MRRDGQIGIGGRERERLIQNIRAAADEDGASSGCRVGGLLCFGESRERPIVASGIWSGQLATPVVIAISAHEKISGGIGGKSWSCDQHRQQKRERFHAGLCY